MKLDIILVNYNSDDSLYNCVKSILNSVQIDLNDIKITVVDNGSTDNSLEKVSSFEKVGIIRNNANLGYGKACNIGFKNTCHDYILLINPDTIVLDSTLHDSIDFLLKNEEIAIMGIKQLNNNNQIQKACCRKPNLINSINSSLGLNKINAKFFKSYKMMDWNHESSGKIFHVIGSFWLFKRELLNEIGSFDEHFFLYYEDLDFSARVNNAGKTIYYNSNISIRHEGGGSSKKDISKRLCNSILSRNRYFKKHFGTLQYIIISFAMIVLEPLIRIMKSILTLDFSNLKYTIKGYILILKNNK